jgi:hypothetical protein
VEVEREQLVVVEVVSSSLLVVQVKVCEVGRLVSVFVNFVLK